MAVLVVVLSLLFVALEIAYCRNQALIFMLTDINEGPIRAWIYENGIYLFRGDKEEIDRLNHAGMRQMETARQVVLGSVLIKDRVIAKRMLEFFISRGLDVNARNGLMDDGNALMDAVGNADDKAVELLLTHGANPDIVCSTSNLKGLTALQTARIFQNKFHDPEYDKIIALLENARRNSVPAQ
jgi:hypothetical protein